MPKKPRSRFRIEPASSADWEDCFLCHHKVNSDGNWSAFHRFRNPEDTIDAHIFTVRGDRDEFLGFGSIRLEHEERLAKCNEISLLNANDPEFYNQVLPEVAHYFKNFLESNGFDYLYLMTNQIPIEYAEVLSRFGLLLFGLTPQKSKTLSTDWISGLTGGYLLASPLYESRAWSPLVDLHPSLRAWVQLIAPYRWPEQAMDTDSIQARMIKRSPTSSRPRLELIEAPEFVLHRFQSQRDRIASAFFPFSLPNTLLTTRDGSLEIYLGIDPKLRTCSFIGERASLATYASDLALSTIQLLKPRGIEYFEILLDGEDQDSIESLLETGFVPMGYFPGIKRHGSKRVDRAILAYHTERSVIPDADLMRYPVNWRDQARSISQVERSRSILI